ncbi:tetratricopeptide repeat protein [Caulobacter sp. KR2-114]|uniref:tetratricopeptide repeat protein n=1 Tax=Caulobacter sp. KR2-114 TaxID=3400912 RepID=UPI003BFD5AE8
MADDVTVEAALKELQDKGGEAALFDDVRCRGVLADRLPDQRARTTSAVTALKAGVAQRLKDTPRELAREAVAREIAMLTRDHAVAPAFATEAVTAWARVLGHDVPAAGGGGRGGGGGPPLAERLKALWANNAVKAGVGVAAVAAVWLAFFSHPREAYPFEHYGLTRDEFAEGTLSDITAKVFSHAGADAIQTKARSKDAQAEGLMCMHSYYTTGENPQDTVQLCKAGAEDKDSYARYVLYLIYWSGDGTGANAVAADKPTAVQYLKDAAAAGNPFAQVALGLSYRNGADPIPKDPEQGFKLLQAADQQGRLLGRLYVGVAYLNGLGVAKDNAKALAIFQALDQKNFGDASFYLGFMEYAGLGLPAPDKTASAAAFARGWARGDGWAGLRLAEQQLQGDGVARNIGAAYDILHTLEGKTGDDTDFAPIASRLLGDIYFNGWGLNAPDKAEAASHYRKASNRGDGEASYKLAGMYQTGDGVGAANVFEAFRLLQLAAQQGYHAPAS